MEKPRAPRNRTISLTEEDRYLYALRLRKLHEAVTPSELLDTTLHHDLMEILDWLPAQFVDLLYIDPPYNLTKMFNERSFRQMPPEQYAAWLEGWLPRLAKILKPTASIYICAEWRSSAVVQQVLERHFMVRNRITWEREKGRGADANWKNVSEDIWFCTVSDRYFFDPDAVKLKRRVIAPYTDEQGQPKDWHETSAGRFRLTHPSNLWTDLTIPFWSMPENTDHPTQKPEKLLAKILLASSQEGEVVFDPFLGSGTTSVVAKKLKRRYVGVEIDEDYCLLAEKRLAMADQDRHIQGYDEGVFLERNSAAERSRHPLKNSQRVEEQMAFLTASNDGASEDEQL